MGRSSGRVLRFGIAGLGTASTSILPEIAAHPHLRVAAAADPRTADGECREDSPAGQGHSRHVPEWRSPGGGRSGPVATSSWLRGRA